MANNERSLLAPEKFLQVPPTLACAIGLNEAIVLQHLYWLQGLPNSGTKIGEDNYVFNTYEQWKRDFFPFWSERTIQRIFLHLEKVGYIASIQPDGLVSRKKYYRVTRSAEINLTHERFRDAANMALSTCQSGTNTIQ
jgi:hypothetical protein